MQKEKLETAALGETGLDISRVGFGAWAIGGGGWEFGWGPQEDEADTTPGAVAVAWTLLNSAVDGAIVGFRRPDQVDPIIAAAGLALSSDDVAEIEGKS